MLDVKQKNPDGLALHHKLLKNAAKKVVAVGFPKGRSQAYPEGEEVAQVAGSHVYGLGVPKRDFMGYAKSDIIAQTKPILRKIGEAESESQVNALQNAAGLKAQAIIQQSIIDLSDPSNSPKTIEKKGSDNPLIDTGHMKDSVTFVVRKK